MAESAAQKTIDFELVTAEQSFPSEPAALVTVPGIDGDMGVLAGHAPVLSTLRPGVVVVQLPGGETKKIFVSGGFVDISGAVCSVLAEEAVNVNEIDRPASEEKLKNLEADLAASKDDPVKFASLEKRIAAKRAKIAAAV